MLVACWNAGRSIERALASVLEPDLDLECIVVDDGSTDGTADLVRRVAAADPRVTVVALSENAGVSNARNIGLDRVRGEWLTLLDADDRFLPGGLGRLMETAASSQARAVIGQQVWSDGGRRRWVPAFYDIPDIRQAGRKSIATNPGLLYFVSPHAKLFHRSTWTGLRFDGRILGDQPWVIRALLRAGNRIEVIEDTIYEWIREPALGADPSITATARSKVARGIEAIHVAERALPAVVAEAEATVPDPGDRRRIGRAYVERLLRSDLAPHVAGAVRRRDAELPALLASVEQFLRSLPRDLVAESDSLTQDLVEPLVRAAPVVRARTRPAIWAFAAAAAEVQPRSHDHARDGVARLGLRLVSRGRATWRRGLAIALLHASRFAALPGDLPRLRRRIQRHLPIGGRP